MRCETRHQIGPFEVVNYVFAGDSMASVPVGFYNGTTQRYNSDAAVVWPGNSTDVPVDYFPEKPIHLALLLAMSGASPHGRRIAGAAALAVERVNANKALLPRHRLEYHWADAGRSARLSTPTASHVHSGMLSMKPAVMAIKGDSQLRTVACLHMYTRTKDPMH